MKILLDECVPWPMHRLLIGHECRTAQQAGWGGIENGRLLKLAETAFRILKRDLTLARTYWIILK